MFSVLVSILFVFSVIGAALSPLLCVRFGVRRSKIPVPPLGVIQQVFEFVDALVLVVFDVGDDPFAEFLFALNQIQHFIDQLVLHQFSARIAKRLPDLDQRLYSGKLRTSRSWTTATSLLFGGAFSLRW